MPVCSTEPMDPKSNNLHHLQEKHFNEMINAKRKMPEHKSSKCANETTMNFNSDSIVDIRRIRRKYRKSVQSGKADYLKGLEMAKMATDKSFDSNSRVSKLSMSDLLHDLNRIRRLSAASGDILGDNLNRIKKCDVNVVSSKNDRNRRKSTNSSLEAQNNAEMKSIILDPENSLHSPRQQDYALPQGKININM